MVKFQDIIDAMEISRNNFKKNLVEHVFYDTLTEKMIYISNPRNSLNKEFKTEILDRYLKNNRYIQIVSLLNDDLLVMKYIESVSDLEIKANLQMAFHGDNRYEKFIKCLEKFGYEKRFEDFCYEQKSIEAQSFCQKHFIEFK